MESATKLQTDSSAGNSTLSVTTMVVGSLQWHKLAHQSPTSPSHMRGNCIEITGGYPLCSLTLKVDANGKD